LSSSKLRLTTPISSATKQRANIGARHEQTPMKPSRRVFHQQSEIVGEQGRKWISIHIFIGKQVEQVKINRRIIQLLKKTSKKSWINLTKRRHISKSGKPKIIHFLGKLQTVATLRRRNRKNMAHVKKKNLRSDFKSKSGCQNW
jgi:hypothetical protein